MKLYLIAAFLLATLVAMPCLAEEKAETTEQEEPLDPEVGQEKRGIPQLSDHSCSILRKSCKEFCNKPKPTKTFILCEHRRGILRCPYGKRIQISYANYGRTTGRRRCPHPAMQTTSCHSAKSNIQIRNSCNGRNLCSLFASNRVYGDPCVGTFKYIEVKYKCI